MKRNQFYLSVLLAVLILLLSLPLGAISFQDTTDHWAKNEINAITDLGLFRGVTETSFAPNDAMTRAMFVTVLGRLAEQDGTVISSSGFLPFVDVSDTAYYAPYVAWAYTSGIVLGTDAAHFSPDTPISREQTCVLLLRFGETVGWFASTDEQTVLPYADASSVSDYALSAVKCAYMRNWIQGRQVESSLIFDPQTTATRAEIATILFRVLQNEHTGPQEETDIQKPTDTNGNGGGNGGNGTDITVSEVRRNLQKILRTYSDPESNARRFIQKNCSAESQDLLALVFASVEDALSSGIELSKESIRSAYSTEIATAKDVYDSLSDDEKGILNNAISRLGTANEIQSLATFFGISF